MPCGNTGRDGHLLTEDEVIISNHTYIYLDFRLLDYRTVKK